MHGARRRKKSDYGLQLDEKQKLKACFGMLTEKQLVISFHKALKVKGNTAEHFMQRLECRLDNVIYRLRFARTIFAAQQLVAHGHVLVNGKKVDRRSFQVRPGMQISIKEKSRKIRAIGDAMDTASHVTPDYYEVDRDSMKGTLLSMPMLDQVEGQLPLPINISVVCEFLAHRT